MPLLELRDLGLRRGGAWAFRGVDLALERGRAHALVGESGSGKSSVLWTVLGLLEPIEGEVRFRGGAWSGLPERLRRPGRRAMQAVLQEAAGALPPHRSARELLEEALRAGGRGGGAESVARLATRVSFPSGALPCRAGQLSGGMAQRLALARAMAPDPELLVLDEPHAGLDAVLAAAFLDLLGELKAAGAALLLASHDLGAVAGLCEDVSVLCAGSVVASGSASRILGDARHPFVRGLLEARPALDGRAPHPWGLEAPPAMGPGCVLRLRCPRADACCEKAPPRAAERCHHPL